MCIHPMRFLNNLSDGLAAFIRRFAAGVTLALSVTGSLPRMSPKREGYFPTSTRRQPPPRPPLRPLFHQTRGIPATREGYFPSHMTRKPPTYSGDFLGDPLTPPHVDSPPAPTSPTAPPNARGPSRSHPPLSQTRGIPATHEGYFPSRMTRKPPTCGNGDENSPAIT